MHGLVLEVYSINYYYNLHYIYIIINNFSGKVYNITPYFKFHPGGKDDLLKGAGKDSTILFDEVISHALVSVDCF